MSQGASHGAAGAETTRHEFADVNGVRLHYAIAQPANPSAGGREGESREATARAGNRKLIVFLHGFPEFWYAWRKQLVEFGQDFIAVAPDMRGYNLSSKPAAVEEYDIRKLVGDVRALVEYLAVSHHVPANKCFLVGHDWGGVVAWGAALAFPDLVEKLVIINAPHPKIFERELRKNPKQQEASHYMLLFRSSQAEEIISANQYALMQDGILGPGIRQGYISEADRKAYVEAWSQPGALTGGLNYYRASEAGPPTAPGGEVFKTHRKIESFEAKMPTLVIWGEQDPYLLTSNLDGLEQYVPRLIIERIPDATHWVVHEKPEQVNSLIRRFLADSR
jgi:pimeloyl-ACP methyl ester carboxylesterase